MHFIHEEIKEWIVTGQSVESVVCLENEFLDDLLS
jgi:hypothetical protein